MLGGPEWAGRREATCPDVRPGGHLQQTEESAHVTTLGREALRLAALRQDGAKESGRRGERRRDQARGKTPRPSQYRTARSKLW
eukprot:CAMPEP_0171611482 /NCGR_PEP_ID=MMETSP0990-20121206/10659_1 /TAXON_ID=483369 /ORGANISM="non described non described, Strain CCMP2098" /LENGTH=83 /DNA_ID=CAMNT_0012175067 /DNA_START=242 /DNA_END=493 /DNA_ORIENTATION=+